MKKIKVTPMVLTIAFTAATNAPAQEKIEKIDTKGIAVLELFTSEGCSSCPPADDLIGKIQREYQDQHVYILAYHVDYWDHQGWKDVFSHSDYTKKQYDYAKLFKTQSIYTPQLVVNGQEEYVGSRETIIRSAITNALSIPATAQLTLKASLDSNKISVNYSVIGTSNESNLSLAVVQKSAKTVVKRGENADRVLSHFQIVHYLHNNTITSNSNGLTELPLPEGFNPQNFEIIGFIQDTNSGAILGAANANF